MTIKTILVDDEPLALQLLERQLKTIARIEVIATFNHFDLQKHKDLIHRSQVVFLDIEMPRVNGLELAEQMIEINPKLLIVFVTAFNEYAVKAFELNALDYLLKPVEEDRLVQTIDRIKGHIVDDREDELSEDELLHIQLCRYLQFPTLTKHGINIIKWRTQKAQELFIYLLYHQGQTISKAHLAELLWPDYGQERSFSQLYTAIYHIRKSLTILSNHLSIKSVHDGYMMITKNITIDIVEWEQKVHKLPPIDEENIANYESVMELYTGPFLNKYDYIWAESERYRLELLWIKVATKLGDFYQSKGFVEQAINWYEEIVRFHPEDEHANISIMKLYASLGYGLLVDHQYHKYKQTLNHLGLPVGLSVDKLYKQLTKDV